jgi:hypothetical protein
MAKTSKKKSGDGNDRKPAGELSVGMWSVVSFDKVEAGGLTYKQATEKLTELQNSKTPGLCIITDSAASRLKK